MPASPVGAVPAPNRSYHSSAKERDPYEVVDSWIGDIESLYKCGEPVNDFGNPLKTENFVAALLRDIRDGTQDDHNGDGIFDRLCLGAGPNFEVVVFDHPLTVTKFISRFRNGFPEETDGLWPTAYSFGGNPYVAGFPDIQRAIKSRLPGTNSTTKWGTALYRTNDRGGTLPAGNDGALPVSTAFDPKGCFLMMPEWRR